MLLGHQNQLEQHLDAKIVKKLKEMGDESAFDNEDLSGADELRVDKEIRQIMS